VEDTFAMNYWK